MLTEGLLRAFASDSFLVTEWRALRGTYGAFDFSMPVRVGTQLRWVHVEVDGQGHTSKAWQSSNLEEQQSRDREKDVAARERGMMLVRLHHMDICGWGRLLKAAA